MDINLTSTFLMCKYVIKKMLKKNMEKLLISHLLSVIPVTSVKQITLLQKPVILLFQKL